MTRSSETGFLGGSTSVRAAKHRAGNPSVRRSSPGARRRLNPKIRSEENCQFLGDVCLESGCQDISA